MTKSSDAATLDAFLDQICHVSPDAQEVVLHDGAAIFGFEEGLFIRSDRQTFMSYARMMRNHQQSRRTVEWRHVNGRIASACLVESHGSDSRVSLLTMMQFDTGWKIITKTFEARSGASL